MTNMGCFTLHLNQDLFTVDISIYTREGGLKKNAIALIPFLSMIIRRVSFLISYTLSSNFEETSKFNKNLCTSYFCYKCQKLIPKTSTFKQKQYPFHLHSHIERTTGDTGGSCLNLKY